MMTSILAADADDDDDEWMMAMEGHQQENDVDDDSHTNQTTVSSPIVLEPPLLGMSLSFDDVHAAVVGGGEHTTTTTTSTVTTNGGGGDNDENDSLMMTNGGGDIMTTATTNYDTSSLHNNTDNRYYYNSSNGGSGSNSSSGDLYVWWVLWRAPILVYTCLFVVPSISSILMNKETLQYLEHVYNRTQHVVYQSMEYMNHHQTFWWCNDDDDANSMCAQWKRWIQHEWIEPTLEYICHVEDDDDGTTALMEWWNNTNDERSFFSLPKAPSWRTYTSLSYWAHYFNLCPLPVEEPEEEEPIIIYRSILDPSIETEWKDDLQILLLVSALLTGLRLVSLLLAKAIHWIRTGHTKQRRQQQDRGVDGANAMETTSNAPEGTRRTEESPTTTTTTTDKPAAATAVEDEPLSETGNDQLAAAATAAEDSCKVISTWHAENSTTMEPLSCTTTTTVVDSSSTRSDSSFSSPTELTEAVVVVDESLPGSAFFRTVCCTAFATFAWQHFHGAHFWPEWLSSSLFGQRQGDDNSGSDHDLNHCWDLIVPFDGPDDSAYEEENALLKLYVLIQASYYVHSVVFRFLHWIVRGRRRRRSSTSLLLSLLQSILALGLLGLAYGVSSLRRLATIGMFALDVSSAVRYFWQWSAPGVAATSSSSSSSWWAARRAFSQFLYWTLVLPLFCATRFYVYPVLWQSATTTAKTDASQEEWRVHLEDELWKGSAEQFLRLCNACIGLLLLVSLFSLQRLIEVGPYHRPRRRRARQSQKPTRVTE